MNAKQIAMMDDAGLDFSDEDVAAYWKQKADDASEGACATDDVGYNPQQYCCFCGEKWDGDEINSMYRLFGDTWVNIYVCDECKYEHAVNGMPLMSAEEYWDMVSQLSIESGLS